MARSYIRGTANRPTRGNVEIIYYLRGIKKSRYVQPEDVETERHLLQLECDKANEEEDKEVEENLTPSEVEQFDHNNHEEWLKIVASDLQEVRACPNDSRLRKKLDASVLAVRAAKDLIDHSLVVKELNTIRKEIELIKRARRERANNVVSNSGDEEDSQSRKQVH